MDHKIPELTARQAAAIAGACYEVNRAYCSLIGDPVGPAWFAVSDEQRAGLMGAVASAWAYPHTTPEQAHERWLEARRSQGWTFGRVRDEVAKTHPCIAPYGDLPEAQRRKDEIFLSTAKMLLQTLR